MKYTPALSLAALGLVAACRSESPTEVSRSVPATSSEVVITEGAAVPVQAPKPRKPSLSTVEGSIGSTVVGSSTMPLTLTPSSCAATATGQVTVVFRTSGNQVGTATFDVYTSATYQNGAWSYSDPVTITVPPRTSGPTGTPVQENEVVITLENASASGAGTTVPNAVFNPVSITNSNSTGAKLGAGSGAVVHVTFADCAHTNLPPSLTVPTDINAEATSSAGAVVPFTVLADDQEDGNLTSAVSCDHDSGATFPLGTTEVVCEVTDSGGLTTTRSFKITVVDTTAARFTSFPAGTVKLIAADINGATLDVGSLGISVEDVDHVSEPSTYSCDYVAGTVLEIGSTTTISCKASDAIGNTSDASTFDVFVGLNVSGTEFLSPLRMASPFSTHKRGSTIPHKFLPPTYADGTPATDLASGLRLVITHVDGSVEGDAMEVNDYSAGSTAWRYDDVDGQYIFNLKSITTWDFGTWRTAVSYRGITLATTEFNLKK